MQTNLQWELDKGGLKPIFAILVEPEGQYREDNKQWC